MQDASLSRAESYMDLAIEAANASGTAGDVPVGCVIVKGDRVIAVCGNTREASKDATGHAEINAIRAACEALGTWHLLDCEMYVTLEPCAMCAGAVISARIPRVYVGVKDPKAGALGSLINLNAYPLNHHPELVFGIRENECRQLLQDFFRIRRAARKPAVTP